MIKTENGDLIQMFKDNKFHGVAHGCNCFYAMNSGIAKTVREEFIEAYRADLKSPYGDPIKLGDMTAAKVAQGTIFNLYTQYRPGKQDDLKQLYSNIEKAFDTLNERIERFVEENLLELPYELGIPKIGSGIAGGDWNEIQDMVEKYLTVPQVTVVNFVPGHVDLFDLK